MTANERELRKLRKYVLEATAATLMIVNRIDELMVLPEVPRREVARLLNALDMANDALMHFGIGYSFAKIKKLKAKKGASA